MSNQFEGFEPANTTPVPDILFDELLTELTEAELKILLYIIRRTWGFKKVTDAISLNQFQHGIVTREGKVLDKGCGIKNRTTLVKNLASLEKKQCIQSEKGTDAKGDKATTLYSICFKNNGVVRKTYQGSAQNVPPVVSEAYYRSTPEALPVVRKTYPQETVLQETVLQESTYATSDEDRLTRTEIKTAFTHVLPEVQAEVTLRQAQQGDDAHATTPSRADDRGSVGAGTRPRVPSVDRHAAETEVAGSQGSQTSRATPRAVRPGDAAREEGISDESHPTRDVSDGALVDATPVRRGVEAVAGASAQSVDTSSSLPPNVAGAVGSAPPSSGPRRSERKKAEQDAVTQAKSDTKEVQRRINEHRGYALEEKLDLIREREAIKSWCRLHEIGDFDITMQYLKRDPYWGKPENYHRIGGVTLLRETPKALAAQAHRKPASKPKEAEALAPLKVLPPVRERRR